MVGFLTPYATDGISYGFGYVFFGTNLAAGIMTYFFLYETKSLALEQVDVMYSEKDVKAWNSKKWMPAGYIDRNKRDSEQFERRHSVDQPTMVEDMNKGKDGEASVGF